MTADPRLGLVADLVALSVWRDRAACLDVGDPEVFFPTRGEDVSAAKAICAGCPVRLECLEFALERVIRQGVFGGMSEHERRLERRNRRREAQGLPRIDPVPADPVERAEARLGFELPPELRSKALWPQPRASRRVGVRGDAALRALVAAAQEAS